MTGGTYTLLFELPRSATVEIGALGEHRLPEGWYAYTGSALGPGGFARVDRHYELSAGERDVRRWHVDYVLGRDDVRLRGDVRSTGADAECPVAAALPDGPVAGFGASDCSCRSHLSQDPDGGILRQAVADAHRRFRSE